MTIANAKPDLLITGPIGTTTVNAASSAWHDYLTVEAKITAAIAYAVSIGAKYCYVPDSFLPYTASLVTFNPTVMMLREGGNHDVFEIEAYGGKGDGIYDNTLGFRAAVAGAEASGGTVQLSYGTYLHDVIYVPSNVTIDGAGTRLTICKMITGAAGDALFLNKTYTTFAMGTEHSWTTRETGITIQNLTIDGNKANVANRYGIHFRPCSYVSVIRVRVVNTALQGIKCTACRGVVIDRCEGAGSSLDAIHLAHCTNFRVLGCGVESSGDFGIEISSGETGADVPPLLYGGDGVVSKNVVYGCTNAGIMLRGLVSAGLNPNNYPVLRTTVEGNTISGCNVGIQVLETVRECNASNNVCSKNTTYGMYISLAGFPTPNDVVVANNNVCLNTGIGIFVTSFAESTLSGNHVTQNASHGVAGSFYQSTITGNTIRNNNTALAATTYNLSLTATSQDVEIRGNDLKDRGTRTTTADVSLVAGQVRIKFVGNNVGTATGPVGDLPITLTDAATVAIDAGMGNPVLCLLTATSGIGATRAIGAPTNPQAGQRLVVTFIQDATGGRALTWNAVFKNTWSDTGNTLNKRSTIAFIYDGTNWNQDGAQTAYV